MTGQERHLHRDAVARANGYRPKPMPEDPEWAGRKLPEMVDDKAAAAARILRGLPVTEKASR